LEFSFSRQECYANCPYQFKLRYLDKLTVMDDYESNNALVLGSAVDTGIQYGVDKAIDYYHSQYTVIDDKLVNEEIKLSILIPKAQKFIANFKNPTFQYYFEVRGVRGYIDIVEENDDGTVNIWDFKHSNNVDRYRASAQVHIYKFCYEFITKKKVKNIGYIFIPKTQIRQKKTEDLHQFRQRLKSVCKEELHVFKETVEYDPNLVVDFFSSVEQIQNKIYLGRSTFEKNETRLCDWCDYKNFCLHGHTYEINEQYKFMKGNDEMITLPKNERIPLDTSTPPVIWIYGAPFSGKTTFANAAPDVLHLNTDGNVKYVDGARIIIKDEITQNGRITETKFAWETFKEVVETLCIGGNDFKNIVIDLVEDLLEFARLYMYSELGIRHEQDARYGKGYDLVRTEFLPQIRKLTNAGYGVILISHENVSEVIKKNGDKITTIAPNIQLRYANKISGMVDIVGRVIIEDDDSRWIKFKTDNIQFGGGRLMFDSDKVKLDYNEFMTLYKTAKPNTESKIHRSEPQSIEDEEIPQPKTEKRSSRGSKKSSANKDEDTTPKQESKPDKVVEEKSEPAADEKPKRTQRKPRNSK
jgi:phage nucleotide-binding protein